MSNLCENCKCNSEIEVCADCDWRTKRYQIPKFATNGDVIKALFPHGRQEAREPMMRFMIDNYAYEFSYKWWNTKYGREVGTGNKIKR